MEAWYLDVSWIFFESLHPQYLRPSKLIFPKRKQSSNEHFSGVMLNLVGVLYEVYDESFVFGKGVHHWKLTWNLKITPSKRKIIFQKIFQTSILGFKMFVFGGDKTSRWGVCRWFPSTFFVSEVAKTLRGRLSNVTCLIFWEGRASGVVGKVRNGIHFPFGGGKDAPLEISD